VMEDCAETLGVSPNVFVEYRLWQARREFDPTEVGIEEAMTALRAWRDSCASQGST